MVEPLKSVGLAILFAKLCWAFSSIDYPNQIKPSQHYTWACVLQCCPWGVVVLQHINYSKVRAKVYAKKLLGVMVTE